MKSAVHYPKDLARAETTSRLQHIEIRNDNGVSLSREQIKELTKASYSLSGAYPYTFDALAYICTHHKDNIERRDNAAESHFRVRLPIKTFLDFALNGHDKYMKAFMVELYEIAARKKEGEIPKVLPINENYSVRTPPLKIDFYLKNSEKVSDAEKKRLANLKGETTLPLEYVAIEFFKPLFERLLNGAYGEAWFSVPKAFHAETRNEIDHVAGTDIFKNDTATVRITPIQARKVFFYINLHDNGIGEKITIDGIELCQSCFPEHISIKDGVKYIDNWNAARLKIKKALILFNSMAKKGLMNGSKFVPIDIQFDVNKVSYDRTAKTFSIKVIRGALNKKGKLSTFPTYKNVPDFKDRPLMIEHNSGEQGANT